MYGQVFLIALFMIVLDIAMLFLLRLQLHGWLKNHDAAACVQVLHNTRLDGCMNT